MYGIVHAMHAVVSFDERTHLIKYFNFSAHDQSLIMRLFPGFHTIEEHFLRVGQRLKPLNLDRLETVLFCALLLFSPGTYCTVYTVLSTDACTRYKHSTVRVQYSRLVAATQLSTGNCATIRYPIHSIRSDQRVATWECQWQVEGKRNASNLLVLYQ